MKQLYICIIPHCVTMEKSRRRMGVRKKGPREERKREKKEGGGGVDKNDGN